MLGNKVFTASKIAYGLEPGSIRLQLMDQFSSLNHIAQKTIFEVEDKAMGELQQSMTHMIVNVRLIRGSVERHQGLRQYIEPSLRDENHMLQANVFEHVIT